MSDWQVGDLALCVDVTDIPMRGGKLGVAGRELRLGAVYRVIGIRPSTLSGYSDDAPYLVLAERSHSTSAARRFRKIRPDEHQACEPEFVTLLKRAKRPVAA